MRRALVLVVLLALGALAIALSRTRPAPDQPRLSWIATAHQFGPVGYRDPAAAMSPDARWVAYSEGRFLRVRSIEGGPGTEFPPGDAQIRHLVWHPDSRTILTDGEPAHGDWALYDRATGSRQLLFPTNAPPIRQPAWSFDGTSIAAIVNGREGSELWVFARDGGERRVQRLAEPASAPAWTPRGVIACITIIDGRRRLTIPCGGTPIRIEPDLDVYGPVAFSPDGGTAYLAMPTNGQTVDLWAVPSEGGRARRLTSFARDTYGPSVAVNGSVAFKVQSYRTVVSLAPAGGGATTPLATFQSETPSWDPTGAFLGITYGTWRRLIDDARYPDIAQEAGIIEVDPRRPAAKPARIVDASESEDQSVCWSPNGKWIAYHSHKDQSDDIWLRSATLDRPSRRVSSLGRGAETGWPRWSPDGRWLLFDGASRTTREGAMYVTGVDQETGAITSDQREVPVRGLAADISHAEWLPDSRTIVAIAKEGPGRHVILTVPRDGGDARIVHRVATEHDAPGLGVSPDGAHVAFVAPAADGFFQIFRMPLAGGSVVQVTRDPSHKTQPAWSPDGRTIAFTVFSYEVQLWAMKR